MLPASILAGFALISGRRGLAVTATPAPPAPSSVSVPGQPMITDVVVNGGGSVTVLGWPSEFLMSGQAASVAPVTSFRLGYASVDGGPYTFVTVAISAVTNGVFSHTFSPGAGLKHFVLAARNEDDSASRQGPNSNQISQTVT
jgi:hypothetical protein